MGQAPSAAPPPARMRVVVLPIKAVANTLEVTAPVSFPPELLGRLTPEELAVVVAVTNETLKTHASLSFLALLLPLVLLDLVSVLLLALFDPWLLVAPWDFALGDIVLPVSLEFLMFFCVFPVTVYALNRRMSAAQAQLRLKLDEFSNFFAERGISFQLRQRLSAAARGCSLWVEVAVAPVLTALLPIAVPVPTLVPVLVDPASLGAGAAGGWAAGKAPARPSSGGGSGSGSADVGSGTAQPTNGWDVVQAQYGALHAEYVRVLHENQLLRQHLQDWQCALMQQQQHAASQQAQPSPFTLQPAPSPPGHPHQE
mmetsp:Transcript_40533/g.100092  ORF Transcript_40533/g.100092 Transcript_40533/m.100092 type:complete len:313 (+) Transcript_40533:203-1141(+)